MTKKPDNHLVLTVFMLVAGYHKDSWRMEGSRSDEIAQLDFVTELAQMCEAAKLDAVFFGDVVDAQTILHGDIMMTGLYEPLTTLSALAAKTKKIGLIGTSSTSFSDPFVLARQMSGLDSLSGGRAGWNAVTSGSGGHNFGLDEMPHPRDRYRKAAEFADVVTKLWDSWSDEAVINNRETGWWADPAKIAEINHEGEFFKVKGPLNMRRSPQGRPVIVQAGTSENGVELGTSIADAIYTVQPDKDRAVEWYRNFKAKAAAKGRDPQKIKILAGLLPVVGRTEEEAQQLLQDLENHINFDRARRQFEHSFKVDTSDLDLNDVIPAERMPENDALGTRYVLARRRVIEEGWSLRDLLVNSSRSGGHLFAVGTAEQIADQMIDWFESGACDGFSLNPPFMPGGLENICTLLVPELVRRGYYRDEYEGNTLREHLGLDRPGAWDTQEERS